MLILLSALAKRCTLLLALCAAPIAAANLPPPTVVTGAGSTFVTPVLIKWTTAYMADYHASGGTKIVYQSVGSGAGIDAIKARRVDFGASDRPLSTEELRSAGLAQFPMVVGGVVPVVNIEGIAPGKLRFTGVLLGTSTSARLRDGMIRRSQSSIRQPFCLMHRLP